MPAYDSTGRLSDSELGDSDMSGSEFSDCVVPKISVMMLDEKEGNRTAHDSLSAASVSNDSQQRISVSSLSHSESS